MSVRAIGESASILPWFWPDAGSLVQLCQSPVLPWKDLRDDPGAVFLLLAHHDPLSVDLEKQTPAPNLLRQAARNLQDDSVPWIDWRHRTVAPIYRTTMAAARLASMIAEYVGSCDPIAAWCGGILATSGWLAVAVTEPNALADCLTASNFSSDPWGAQLRTWGLSRGDIAWRLACGWALPNWARVLMGGLSYSPEDADRVGGLARLHAVVQTAVVLAEELETPLGLNKEFDVAEAHAELLLRSADLDSIRTRFSNARDHGRLFQRDWQHPNSVPNLSDELEKAAESPEAEIDRSGTIPFVSIEQNEPLHAAKLEALAELAAGASHEINNPLAVISANSQYLLKQEIPSSHRKALEAIVRQTERVHGILRELMFFARPPAPKFDHIDLGVVATDSIKALQPVADERNIRLDLTIPGNPVMLDADAEQIKNILMSLVRNGIEAAGKQGCVRLKLNCKSDRVDIVVEDSGSGPDEIAREHLFDPFFSGRSAGRGRGLGLSTAWQLARQHGGNVKYIPVVNGLTRFVCSLPLAVPQAQPVRKSA